ncbi:MAG: AIR synthase family protein [Nitrososphaeria archaeon]
MVYMKVFGKLDEDTLRKYVLANVGVGDKDILQPAAVGVDFTVIRCLDRYLIVSADPVTGVRKNIGWYAVNVSANDVATSGNRPRFLVNVMLLSQKEDTASLSEITRDVNRACSKLGISVVGGHSETAQGIRQTILVITSFTLAEKYVSSKNARSGDVILMTKTAGLEGTSILANDYGKRLTSLDPVELKNASKMFEEISIVDAAEIAFRTGWVHAMHDPTEGGVLGGIYEMSVASGIGFILDEKKVPIAQETKLICKALRIDPLKLISSGVLLMSVHPKGKDYVKEALKNGGIQVSEVGRFSEGDRILVRDGQKVVVKKSPIDELWRVKMRRL